MAKKSTKLQTAELNKEAPATVPEPKSKKKAATPKVEEAPIPAPASEPKAKKKAATPKVEEAPIPAPASEPKAKKKAATPKVEEAPIPAPVPEPKAKKKAVTPKVEEAPAPVPEPKAKKKAATPKVEEAPVPAQESTPEPKAKKKATPKVEEATAPVPEPKAKKKAVTPKVEEAPAPVPEPKAKKKATPKVEEAPALVPEPKSKKKATPKVEEATAPAPAPEPVIDSEQETTENKVELIQKAEKTNGNDKKTAKGKSSYPDKINYRLEQIYFKLNTEKVEGIYVSSLPNIRYLTNFSGSDAHLFIFKNNIIFVTDDRYEEQIKTELYPLPNLQTIITRDVWGTLQNLNILSQYQEIGFESDVLSYQDAVEYRNKIRPVKFKPIPEAVEPTTRSKAPEELENIRQACTISEKVFNFLLNFIKPGMSEKDIAIEIAYQSRKMGSEGDAFDIIVTSGTRGALVHGQPSEKKIRKGDIVIIDFGCKVNGFCSDITRTICVGAKPTKEQKNIYSLIRSAQKKAIETMRPGINGKILDAAARKMIQEAGYGDYFKHSLGHGIGIVPHEKPIITFRKDDQNVPEDAVVAIEPGIYIPEKYGMRVEDNVHLTKNGPVMLTNASDELIST